MPKREDNPNPEEPRREAGASEREGKGREEGKSPGDVASGRKAAARKEPGANKKGMKDEE